MVSLSIIDYIFIYIAGFFYTAIIFRWIYCNEILPDKELMVITLLIIFWPLTLPIITLIILVFGLSKIIEWFINL